MIIWLLITSSNKNCFHKFDDDNNSGQALTVKDKCTKKTFLSKGVLLSSERQCHLVTLTHEAPTNQFLEDIAEKLGPHLGDGYRIDLLPDEGGFGITSPTDVEIVVRLACPAVRPENRKDDEAEPEITDQSLGTADIYFF